VIADQVIFKNGVTVFENKDSAVQDFLLAVYQYFDINYPKFYKMDHLSKLGWLAAEILLKGEGVQQQYAPEQVGIVLSNANSSLDTDIRYYQTVADMASPGLFVYTLPNIMTGEICIRNNFKGENAFFISDHFDTVFMKQYVGTLLGSDVSELCICGWVDVYGADYKAALFLIKKGSNEQLVPFTANNMDTIFKSGKI
jgi:hypothetical protein